MEEIHGPDIQFVDRGQCPLCGTDSSSNHIAFDELPVVRCSSCGFLYSGRLMCEKDLSDYYSQGFGSERHRQGQLVNAKINAWAVGRLLPVEQIRSFLDVGTGYGYLLREMQLRYDIQGKGVELSEQESRYGKDELGLDITNGSLSEPGLAARSFDLVACFEVIEHIPNPVAFMKALIGYVKPGGYLVVMTDNFECQVARDLGPSFPKWIPHSHISHFGPKTLESLFDDQGIRIVGRLSYTPWELLARLQHYRLRGIQLTPREAFDLSDALSSEMHGHYHLFALRRLVNSLWARLTARNDLGGALMYLVGKVDSSR